MLADDPDQVIDRPLPNLRAEIDEFQTREICRAVARRRFRAMNDLSPQHKDVMVFCFDQEAIPLHVADPSLQRRPDEKSASADVQQCYGKVGSLNFAANPTADGKTGMAPRRGHARRAVGSIALDRHFQGNRPLTRLAVSANVRHASPSTL